MAAIILLCNIPNIHSMDDSLLGKKLCKASKKNDIKKVKELLSQGANPNYLQSTLTDTPLLSAASRGNVEIVKVLIDAGANVNKEQPSFGHTPLHFAVISQHLPVVLALIEAGAKVNTETKMGTTPMGNAAYHDNVAIGKELLKHGASLTGTSEEWKKKLADSLIKE